MATHDSPTAVAMSGGVDSSVAAGLLARQQRRVVGFSMQLIDGLVDQWRWHCDVDDRLSRLAG